MGLDMFAFHAPAALVGEQQVDIVLPSERKNEVAEFYYWRKHHDLHGWMKQLYRAKGGKDHQFNCNTVRLTLDDLRELERAVNEEGAVLPVTTGFFFGDNPPDSKSRKGDLAFIKEARRLIAAGEAVWYDSWW